MNALFLPGNSARHGEWVEEMKNALSTHFSEITTQHYRHWQTGEEWADVEYEMNVANKHENTLRPYVIIAKSIGTVIAAKGVAEGALHPEKIILLGVPIQGGAPVDSFVEWVRRIEKPVVIVQNTADPLGSFSELRGIFKDAKSNISFVELAGETHDYTDFESIAALI